MPVDKAQRIALMKDTLERLVHLIKRQRDTKGDRCHLLITQQGHSNDLFEGYKSLAALLKEGYFSTAVITNSVDMLEKALEEIGVFPPAYQIVTFGRDPDEKVAIALDGQENGICIIKLPIHESVPFADDIQDSLRGYLHENVVIVGYINGSSSSIVEALDKERTKGSVYCIVPREPDGAILPNQLQHRYKQYENFLIYGSEGKFVNFFNKLARVLLHDDPISSEHDIIANGDQYSQKEGGATDRSNGDTHLVSVDSPARENPSLLPTTLQAEATSEAILIEDRPKGEVLSEPDSEPLEDGMRNTGPLPPDPSLDKMKNAIRELPWPAEVDVLIVTATRVELRAVLAQRPAYVRKTLRERTYYDLGYIGEVRTAVVQANDTGSLEAHATVEDGIRALSPDAVIMTGIAFGLRAREQQLGDVLVSALIHDYDSERVSTGLDGQLIIEQRGTRVKATGWLLDRFNAGSQDWPFPVEIHFGAILSGSKLVDNREYQNLLQRSAQDAIGGEMEGVGLLKAADRYHMSWLLVKGISDWGDGTKGENKENNQKRAAENAASFVLFVIGQEDFMHKPRGGKG
jgi:nucleoside phosphorylase